MSWCDLLFAHWPVPVAALRRHIPGALEVDTVDGWAWVGVVPFRMEHVRPRLLPAVPPLSAFCELNVRTYVVHRGRPGVWFFSLDAARPLAVRVGRRFFHLPYMDATMRCDRTGEEVTYESARTHRGEPAARFEARYQPTGDVFRSGAASIEEWLTERYCFFCVDRRGRVRCAEVDHAPWPLQPAEADLRLNTMASPLGIALPPDAPLLHFARRIDVVGWPALSDDRG